jgi:hypothetical protein
MIATYTKKHWLNELKESVDFLESLYQTNVFNEEIEFKMEKTIFLGSYIIRKLNESKLLSNEISKFNINVTSYPADIDGHNLNHGNWHKKYKLIGGDVHKISLINLSNQFIHSKIYSPFIPGGLGCMGFFFASDFKCEKQVFYIRIIDIMSVFLSVSLEKNS